MRTSFKNYSVDPADQSSIAADGASSADDQRRSNDLLGWFESEQCIHCCDELTLKIDMDTFDYIASWVSEIDQLVDSVNTCFNLNVVLPYRGTNGGLV